MSCSCSLQGSGSARLRMPHVESDHTPFLQPQPSRHLGFCSAPLLWCYSENTESHCRVHPDKQREHTECPALLITSISSHDFFMEALLHHLSLSEWWLCFPLLQHPGVSWHHFGAAAQICFKVLSQTFVSWESMPPFDLLPWFLRNKLNHRKHNMFCTFTIHPGLELFWSFKNLISLTCKLLWLKVVVDMNTYE